MIVMQALFQYHTANFGVSVDVQYVNLSEMMLYQDLLTYEASCAVVEWDHTLWVGCLYA